MKADCKRANDPVGVTCVFAFDAMPVLQLAVEQHEYLVPPHTLKTHAYVLDEHVEVDRHEYEVVVIEPATYVEAVYFVVVVDILKYNYNNIKSHFYLLDIVCIQSLGLL